MSSTAAALAAAQTDAQLLESALALADTNVAIARARYDTAAAAFAAAQAARSASQALAATLADGWTGEGLPGLPDGSELERRRATLTTRLASIERLEDERIQLMTAIDVERDRQSLQALITEIEDLGGKGAADDMNLHAGRLTVALAAATAALSRTRQVNAVVRAFSETLHNEAEAFSGKFLAPLNDLILAYNEALLSTPGDSVQFHADNRVDTTRFGMGLKFQDRWEDHTFDKTLSPQAILSEGQIAANGFSILCAASTAYPWSRWRSLLLDDPLQHNDIIHAAAFVDLMRNLVELKNYQLLMSSHDRSEADFIARKFDAAGLPCQIINLTAPARSGGSFSVLPLGWGSSLGL